MTSPAFISVAATSSEASCRYLYAEERNYNMTLSKAKVSRQPESVIFLTSFEYVLNCGTFRLEKPLNVQFPCWTVTKMEQAETKQR
jgi:uncharacterized protein (UPF0303 family)